MGELKGVQPTFWHKDQSSRWHPWQPGEHSGPLPQRGGWSGSCTWGTSGSGRAPPPLHRPSPARNRINTIETVHSGCFKRGLVTGRQTWEVEALPHPHRERCLWLHRPLRFSLSVEGGRGQDYSRSITDLDEDNKMLLSCNWVFYAQGQLSRGTRWSFSSGSSSVSSGPLGFPQ